MELTPQGLRRRHPHLPGLRELSWNDPQVRHQHLPSMLSHLLQGYRLREVPLNGVDLGGLNLAEILILQILTLNVGHIMMRHIGCACNIRLHKAVHDFVALIFIALNVVDWYAT